jgi:hypothetical protein
MTEAAASSSLLRLPHPLRRPVRGPHGHGHLLDEGIERRRELGPGAAQQRPAVVAADEEDSVDSAGDSGDVAVVLQGGDGLTASGHRAGSSGSSGSSLPAIGRTGVRPVRLTLTEGLVVVAAHECPLDNGHSVASRPPAAVTPTCAITRRSGTLAPIGDGHSQRCSVGASSAKTRLASFHVRQGSLRRHQGVRRAQSGSGSVSIVGVGH